MAIDVTVSGLNTVVDVTMDETALIDADSGQVVLVEDYNNLSNKPQINGITLSGNKTSSDIGVADASHTHTTSEITDLPTIPTDTSDLTNGAGFITSSDIPVTDVKLDGTSVVSSGVAALTTPTIHNVPSGGSSGQVLSKASATDYDLAWVNQSGGGASAFEAEFGTTTYSDVKDAYDNDAILICTVDDSGNTMTLQLVYFDVANEIFYFAFPTSDGWYLTQLSNADGWGDGQFFFASTDVATQLADGLMSALDKQKLDTIASGAEVNVQSDWNQATNTADDYIKNKPTIPTITDTYDGTSSNGMSGKAVKSAIDALDGTISGSAGSGKTLTAFSQTDGKVSATFGNISITKSQVSDFPTIPTNVSDLNNDSGFTATSITRYTTTGTNIADLTIDGTTTKLYAPTGGGGGITDVEVDGTSVVTGGVAEINLTGKSDVGHTHTTSAITDFPSLATVATSGDYDDLTDKPTIPSKVSDLNNDSGFITSPNVVYCTCATEQSTVAKVATIESGSLTTLTTGTQAIVKFTNANAATNPTLQVGSTAAKSIKRYGTSAPSTSSAGSWNGGSCIYFVYDGSYWQMIGFLNSTYSAISKTNIESSSSTSTGLITGQRAAQAVAKHESVSDVTVGGTSVMSGKTAVVPAIPTDTGDLTNGAGFLDKTGILNLFYPVGSYYETSDTTFDPNNSWGGTWVLETEGQVHISAGANYTVSGAPTDTTDGGAETVTLTTDEIPAHTHGSKSLTGSATAYNDCGLIAGAGTATGILSKGTTKLGNYRLKWEADSNGSYSLKADASHEHDSVGSGDAHNNMPPYIIVNRWHRTA